MSQAGPFDKWGWSGDTSQAGTWEELVHETASPGYGESSSVTELVLGNSDFAVQLGIPRAILTSRLKSPSREGVPTREGDAAGGVEYRLTAKGIALWPAVRTLMSWGDEFYSPGGARRALRHDQDGGMLDDESGCRDCGLVVPVPEVRIEVGEDCP